MQYRQYRDTDIKTSLLGLGCMRFPMKDGKIDFEKAEEIIDYAYNHGVNYFDSAYAYGADGDSEKVSGRALSKYPRESYYIASKIPGNRMDSREMIIETLEEQLSRWGTTYIDFYMLHGYMNPAFKTYSQPHVIETLLELKAQGKIRNIGFSSHADIKGLEDMLKHHSFDFCQIQFNYFDWDYQNAKGQYELLEKYGVPVMVMEPVRGGRLASVTAEVDEMLKKHSPNASIASWAIRYAASFPNMQVVLSGMSDMEQVKDNVATMESFKPMSDEEVELLMKAADMLRAQALIPCTKCRYCTETCPQELDIPMLLSAYNDYKLAPSFFRLLPIKAMPEEKRAGGCVACGACVEKCPQSIDIPGELAGFDTAFKNTKFPG